MRIIVTKSSVWSIDEEKSEFNRSPRKEGFAHPIVDYTDAWQPYVSIDEVEIDEDRVMFFVNCGNPRDNLRSSYLKSEQS